MGEEVWLPAVSAGRTEVRLEQLLYYTKRTAPVADSDSENGGGFLAGGYDRFHVFVALLRFLAVDKKFHILYNVISAIKGLR